MKVPNYINITVLTDCCGVADRSGVADRTGVADHSDVADRSGVLVDRWCSAAASLCAIVCIRVCVKGNSCYKSYQSKLII